MSQGVAVEECGKMRGVREEPPSLSEPGRFVGMLRLRREIALLASPLRSALQALRTLFQRGIHRRTRSQNPLASRSGEDCRDPSTAQGDRFAISLLRSA